MSPFTVNTTRDVGDQAENTLAGSRLNSKLSYARKFSRLRGRVTFQVNINNRLDHDEIIPVRLMTSDLHVGPGRGVASGRYDYVSPREIRFMTTYSY